MKETNKTYSTSSTEAWADAKNYDPETHVNMPSEEAVNNAKEWVEGNAL